MIKMTYLHLFLVLLLGVYSCYAEEISLTINNLKLDKDNLQFDFVLTNNTANPIWFCSDINAKSTMNYEIEINKKEILFRFASITVPPNIFLDEPIWTKYLKLESKKDFKGNIKAKVPIHEMSYFLRKKSNESLQAVTYADTIKLKIGVYKMNLEEYKKVCCRDDSNSQEAFVNCFWAEKNKEHIIKTQINNQNIPITIR
ncbi:hypothetical protein BMS3Abin07_01882 [bacterium BMS3Abin07]|nr:hypothetical protein BMS3Abin07_01882 [bacterium BMS3Abin07]GBE32054.1 hypothetical protein BMS3Bbin05_00962 [bacterium BMS3Bbin05]HDO23525.1 hypothetical protein [Nitrospirota bacterium]